MKLALPEKLCIDTPQTVKGLDSRPNILLFVASCL